MYKLWKLYKHKGALVLNQACVLYLSTVAVDSEYFTFKSFENIKNPLSLSYSAYFSWLPVDYAEISYWPIFCFLHTP